MNRKGNNPHQQFWIGNADNLQWGNDAIHQAIVHINRPAFFVFKGDQYAATHNGWMLCGELTARELPSNRFPLAGYIPAFGPENLGDDTFKTDYGLKYPYIMGAMANGITSVEMVKAAGKAGMIGFFGSGGLPIEKVASAIDTLQKVDSVAIYGFNLIHSPNDQALESAIVDLYLARNINLISASAYLGITPALVKYRVSKIFQSPTGEIVCPNRIIAKVSREEVARKFFSPPPEAILKALVKDGTVTEYQAQLAGHIPLAQDITAEADSGGHTDNRPALSLLPTIMAIRDNAQSKYDYSFPLRVGLGGGIATPESTAAAFSMGAAYVLTGSVNQSCREADTSSTVCRMLAEAQQADVVMAPAADMFELGVKVQVLKRGTMFAMRATKLHDLYRLYEKFEAIPDQDRIWVEKDLLKCPFETAWQDTRRYFENRNPEFIEKAERDARFKMALVFRSYLGQASLWAKSGDETRQIDYQIWCGPSMGAFNAWAKNTFLESPDNRYVAEIAINLLFGACCLIRKQWLINQGIRLAASIGDFHPTPLNELKALMT